jgi:hypothetical protein
MLKSNFYHNFWAILYLQTNKVFFFSLTCCFLRGYQSKTAFMENNIILSSTITCPVCGHQKEEIMPVDACQYFYQCENCKTILKPKPGDCCVFCSYGTVKCPPMQVQGKCC